MSPLVLVSPDDLRTMLREVVAEVIAEREPPDAPALLDRRAMASMLGVGVDTLDKLRREGLPEIRVGDAPRFHPPDVLEWLKSRGADR